MDFGLTTTMDRGLNSVDHLLLMHTVTVKLKVPFLHNSIKNGLDCIHQSKFFIVFVFLIIFFLEQILEIMNGKNMDHALFLICQAKIKPSSALPILLINP